jgi:hypothetical protein
MPLEEFLQRASQEIATKGVAQATPEPATAR